MLILDVKHAFKFMLLMGRPLVGWYYAGVTDVNCR